MYYANGSIPLPTSVCKFAVVDRQQPKSFTFNNFNVSTTSEIKGP